MSGVVIVPDAFAKSFDSAVGVFGPLQMHGAGILT